MLTSGLDDYLSKPASEQQLMHMLEKWHLPPTVKNSKAPPDIRYNIFDNKLDHCVDRTSALQVCGNRAELAIEMLEILLSRLEDERELINAAISNNDLSIG